MADSILIDYVSTLLRTKAGGANLDHAASVLSDAASLINLLDAQNEDNGAAVSELSAKAKSLAQSKSPAQKTAGLNALTVFAEQGSRAVFLANFVEWSTEALTALKTSSSQSEDTLQASWRHMAAIFRRTGRLLHIPGVRRDAAPLANKLTAAISQAAGEKATNPATSELAFLALHAALLAVPTSFKPHMKTLEHVVSRAMLAASRSSISANSTSNNAAPAAAILAFAALPRAGGDSSDWSAAAQRLFVSAHALLDQAYLGLEPSGLVDNCRQGLDSTATVLPGVVDATSNTTTMTGGMDSYALTFGQLDAILSSLEAQLTTTFPTPIPLPSSPLLLLATRILSVDADSVAERSAASTGKLAELCLRLPALHSRALNLLKTLTLVAGVQLTPLLLSVARILGDQLGKVAVDPAEGEITKACPSVKISLYKATAVVLRAGGVAAARQLAPILLQCAYVEIYGIAAPSEKGAGAHLMNNTNRRGGAMEAQPSRKRAKHVKHRSDDFINVHGPDNAGSISELAALRSQTAFLETLEALLEAGAPLLTFGQRARVDDIIAHAACTAADAALKSRHTAEGGDAAPLVGLQLASLKALLASVLAPASYRPPHVSVALSLFKNGVRHQSQGIAQFTSHALLCCEALMHPRALPRPAPLKPTATADASVDAAVLGMPRFWSFIDADAWLKLQQAQQQLTLAEEHVGLDETDDMGVEGAGKRKRKTSLQKKEPKAAVGFLSPKPASLVEKEEEEEEKEKPVQQQPVAEAKALPVLPPLPKITPQKVNANAAAAAAAPMPLRATTAAAAADESDEESLPEIDSGASSSEED